MPSEPMPDDMLARARAWLRPEQWWFDERADRLGLARRPAELWEWDVTEELNAHKKMLVDLHQRALENTEAKMMVIQADFLVRGEPIEGQTVGHIPSADQQREGNAIQGAIARANHGLAYERALVGWFDEPAMLTETGRALEQLATSAPEAARIIEEIGEEEAGYSLAELPPGSIAEWEAFAKGIAALSTEYPDLYRWWRAIVRSVFAGVERPTVDGP